MHQIAISHIFPALLLLWARKHVCCWSASAPCGNLVPEQDLYREAREIMGPSRSKRTGIREPAASGPVPHPLEEARESEPVLPQQETLGTCLRQHRESNSEA